MDRYFEKYSDVLFSLLTALVFWWLVGDILDNLADDFLAVIAFAAALVSTVMFVYELIDTLGGKRADADGGS